MASTRRKSSKSRTSKRASKRPSKKARKASRAASCGCAAVYQALVKVEQIHSGRVKKLIAQARKGLASKKSTRSRKAGRMTGSRSSDWETSGGTPSERDTRDEF